MLPGVTPTYFNRVDAVEVAERAVTLHVSSRPETARWATLAGHMFTVRMTAPLPDVVRIEIVHYKGRRRRGPHFELQGGSLPLAVTDDAESLELTTGALTVRVHKNPWRLDFIDAISGEILTSSPLKALGLMEKVGHGMHLREQLDLAPGELVYGLGERFSAFTRNGQSVRMWNSDCGTCSDKGYKDVPFFLTSRGWGVLVNSPGAVSFEIGTEQVMRAQFSVPEHELDYYFIRGPEPRGVVEKLGAICGRPALPPAWSFGLWLTTSFTTDYDEATVTGFVEGMRERNIPLHVFHFDCFWMKGHHWVNLEWDTDVFPDPQGMLTRMHAQGLRVCVWINPYVGERSHLFEEGLRGGYLLRRPDGDVYQRDQWQAGMAYVDFTNPEATRWYQDKLRALVAMGVDCFKTDFGEEIPTDVEWHDGSDPARMHNYYPFLYNRAVFDVLEAERGSGEAVVFARSATATCQRFPVHWGGDCYGNFGSMAESLRGGLSLALCGFGYWSHDIGGFEDKAPPAVYKRWVAFGLLSSHSRLHGSNSYRVPWLYDEEAVDVVRYFTRLKCRLMPYLMGVAGEAHRTSVPMMRAMVLERPDDPACRTLDRQYFLGSDLLVAPVFHESRAEYYLPDGEWTHLLTGEVRTGGRWVREELGFLSVPVYVRPNAMVPMSREAAQVEYDYTKDLGLVCGRLDGTTPIGVDVAVPGGSSVRFELNQTGRHVELTASSDCEGFSVVLPWAKSAEKVDGAEVVPPERRGERLPGDPVAGVVLRAKRGRIAFDWT